MKHRFTVVVPCYNEESTLEASVQRLLDAFAGHDGVELDVIVVDDCSRDRSREIATRIVESHPNVKLLAHATNQGKGAALRTGFAAASGEFVGIHDADLEYDPNDLRDLLVPLQQGTADVVYGSRFLTGRMHRVLYYWHSVGNKFLTFLSNVFTDLNLTDMETCYKIFRKDVLDRIEIRETRFGFEPEITAKVASLRVRVYESGISYFGRTYEEGKKIGVKDGFRALYCILKYNAHRAPIALQFIVYLFVGGVAAALNISMFWMLRAFEFSVDSAAALAFVAAATLNYLLCITLLFRHEVRWSSHRELAIYWLVAAAVGVVDVMTTKALIWGGVQEVLAKALSCMAGVFFNFAGRRWLVFPEMGRGPWARQTPAD